MASLIPKLDLSAITNKGEVQASLIAWNWDFSLVKLEAPKEFGEVQNAISSLRKSNAENGDLHKTARRLGALFEGASPDAPHLLRAYGTRVSEICTLKNIEHHKNSHGIFAGWSGLDAASIWAAATSGDHAIAIHLLACMIAEIYDSQSAAVALWTELVHRRKERLAIEIENSTDQVKREAKMIARLQDISRADLAAWDNSARAWVRTANEAKQKERQRVMLRVEKIGLFVNNVADPYESVMRAWKDAMEAIDKLAQGIPQRVDDGAIPLGIGAWHLYPNLNVLSEGPDPVLQNDPLIPSTAILTIDYEARAETESGIRWSLPLSYMRYYGPPVNTEQRITIDSSRITMDQFGFVLLGCAIAQWHDVLKPVPKAVGFAIKLLEALMTPARSNVKNQDHIARMQKITARSSWIGQLLRAAEEFDTGDKDEREIALKLINYGRRCSGFLCDDRDHPPPYFGLCEMKPLFRLLNGSEHRITYLRELARHWDLSNQNCIIQYRHTEQGAEVVEYCSIKPFAEQFGYTAANEGYLRRRSKKPVGAGRFGRWLTVYSKNTPCRCKGPCLRPEDIQPPKRGTLFTKEVACPCWENGGCGLACHDWNKMKVSDCGSLHNGLLLRRRDEITKMGELCAIAHRIATDRDPDNGKVEFGAETDLQSALVEFAHEKAIRDKARAKNKSTENLPGYFLSFQFAAGCQGDRASAAIVATGHITKSGVDPRKGKPGGDLRQIGEFLPAKVMDAVFDASHFDFQRLTEWFATDLRAKYGNYIQPLRATAATMEIYTRLGPDATIKTSITDKSTLKTARWIPRQEEQNASPLRIKLSKAEAFACIAMFESGGLNIDPVGLKEVFAMTSGNSIFVSSSVICDPFTQPSENEIQRVPGNIGESGLSFLIPPSNPLVKSKRETDWSVINHHPFSGEFEPNFEKTSIHLLKTGFASELRGMHDKGYFIDREATLLEIAAQVFHGEEWIGDLDILSALQGSMLTRAACQRHTAPGSSNNHQHGKTPYGDIFADDEIVNADCWDEVLTEALDSRYVIVRASGEQVSGGQSNTSVKSNQWLARLAASAISVQLGNHTVILPPDVCWLCVKTHLESLGETRVVLIG